MNHRLPGSRGGVRTLPVVVMTLLPTLLLTMAVAMTVSGQSTLQETWTMDTDPGWTCDPPLWAFGRPTGQGGAYGEPDPASGHTGSNVCGCNLEGDYLDDMSSTEWLTTGTIDCADLSGVELGFWRWLGVEQAAYDHADLDVSNDGGATWTTIWSNQETLAGGEWVQQVLDISGVADGHPDVRVRWGMGPTDGSWSFCGWNIDDVEIGGSGLTPVDSRSWGQIKAILR